MARGVAPVAVSSAIEASLPFAVGDSVARMVSPYAAGPFYQNPLRRIVERFHYDDVCGDPGPAFHICATNVRTGKIRVFTGDEIGPEAIMASACLPTLFKAVEIHDPRPDGWRPTGTAAIPATPRFSRCSSRIFPATSWW
jgi:NTE family protein